MRDLDERLHGIDRLSPPDLLSEARAKAECTPPKGSGVAMTATRRLATIVVALVIGLSGVAVLVLAFDRNYEQATPAVARAGEDRLHVGHLPGWSRPAVLDGSGWLGRGPTLAGHGQLFVRECLS